MDPTSPAGTGTEARQAKSFSSSEDRGFSIVPFRPTPIADFAETMNRILSRLTRLLVVASVVSVAYDPRSLADTDTTPDAASPVERKILDRARTHWAFQPIDRSITPPSPEGDALSPTPIHPIDAFIRATLKAKGLEPAPPAPPRDQIRRLYFALIGLPPAPEAVEAFERDPTDEHYARIIDQLLARPQYGERWARHWLDLARYTESTGFEYDRLRDRAWPYRDYVIRSLNEDKPYDRFMREQIAGDVLEPVTRDGILGASLLVCGAYDQAGNNQANLTQRAITREEELEDLVSVVGQTFLGLTLNCARCHDHKFDPVLLTDYYRIKSVFDGVQHGERPVETPAETRARESRMTDLRRDIAEADAQAGRLHQAGWQVAQARRGPTTAPTGPKPLVHWTFESSTFSALEGTLEGGALIREGRLELPSPGAYFQSPPLARDIREKTLEAWVSLSDPAQRGGAAISLESVDGKEFDAIVFGEQQPGKWTAGSAGLARTKNLDAPAEDTLPGGRIHLAIVYSSDNSVSVFRNGKPYGKPYTPARGLIPFKAGDSRIVLGLRHHGGGTPWLTGSIHQAALHDRALTPEEIAASFHAADLAIPDAEVLAALAPDQRAAYDTARARSTDARKALAAASQPESIAYAGKRTQPAPTQRLKRGDVKSPDGIVTPGAMLALTDVLGDLDLPADAPESERRIRFARWLSDPRHPLPARVLVNRVWYHHFGQGLVTTPSDFGASGTPPTHPELLDWLANRFLAKGWSVKSLHRLVVTSATFRQSSAIRPDAAALDADNQWLWRYPPRRLEAEILRDSMLAVSGRLNPQVGGPSFRPFTTTDFNATFYHPFDKNEPEYNRRTVYRMNVNSGKDPLLDAFDCPDPSIKTPRRATTTTPLQALGLMNGTFTRRQANLLAERAAAPTTTTTTTDTGSHHDPTAAVRNAYRLALGRPPTSQESESAVAVARELGLSSVCWVLLNSTEFLYVR